MNTTQKVEKKFNNLFGNKNKLVIKSPGRVNLIGEHTDYNEGWVLPASIDKCSTVLLAENNLAHCRIFAYDLDKLFEFKLDTEQTAWGWENYIYGIVKEMQSRGANLSSFDLMVTGEVPFGAGMSSSASIECATAFGLNELFNCGFSRSELAHISQMAEHHFVGVKCGIMDQFTSLMGKDNHCIFLDCKTLDYEYVPLDLGDYKLLLCNTNVSHSLAGSEYNTRREQCLEGVRFLQEQGHDFESLRNVPPELLLRYSEEMERDIFKRCYHVVHENQRVKKAVGILKESKDIRALGEELYQSHHTLSRYYEVSCPELDFLVGETFHHKEITGSRMMGGGFGGCTINIIHQDAIDSFIEETGLKYLKKFGKEMTPYIVTLGDGSRIVD